MSLSDAHLLWHNGRGGGWGGGWLLYKVWKLCQFFWLGHWTQTWQRHWSKPVKLEELPHFLPRLLCSSTCVNELCILIDSQQKLEDGLFFSMRINKRNYTPWKRAASLWIEAVLLLPGDVVAFLQVRLWSSLKPLHGDVADTSLGCCRRLLQGAL